VKFTSEHLVAIILHVTVKFHIRKLIFKLNIGCSRKWQCKKRQKNRLRFYATSVISGKSHICSRTATALPTTYQRKLHHFQCIQSCIHKWNFQGCLNKWLLQHNCRVPRHIRQCLKVQDKNDFWKRDLKQTIKPFDVQNWMALPHFYGSLP